MDGISWEGKGMLEKEPRPSTNAHVHLEFQERWRKQDQQPGQWSGGQPTHSGILEPRMGQCLERKPQSNCPMLPRDWPRGAVRFGLMESTDDLDKCCFDLQFDHTHFPCSSIHRAGYSLCPSPSPHATGQATNSHWLPAFQSAFQISRGDAIGLMDLYSPQSIRCASGSGCV